MLSFLSHGLYPVHDNKKWMINPFGAFSKHMHPTFYYCYMQLANLTSNNSKTSDVRQREREREDIREFQKLTNIMFCNINIILCN